MATNRIYERGNQLEYEIANTSSGDPVVIEDLPGVALTDSDDDDNVTVQHDGVFELAVHAHDGDTTDTAVSVGDIVYYDADATDASLNVNDSEPRFGYALEAITAGETETIQVKVGY